MEREERSRKKLDNQEYFKLRQATEKIANALSKRLSGHLEILRPLFLPRKLLGTYIKSAVMEDVPKSDKAFAEFQELYASICEKPFGLPRRLEPPLPSISNQLEMAPFQYSLSLGGPEEKIITITSPTQWVLSYQTDCPLSRLRGMVSGIESRQPDEMRQTLMNHIVLFIFLNHFPSIKKLFEDLRYQVEAKELTDLGKLPVIVLKAPVETFLPPDDFILQVTQLSGIAAFQEIIDLGAIENISDNLKDSLRNLIQ